MVRIRLALVAVLLAAPAAAEETRPAAAPTWGGFPRPAPKQGYDYPKCYCTDSEGGRVEVGETACLTIDRREVTSRCEQADNLVIWRHQREGCPGV